MKIIRGKKSSVSDSFKKPDPGDSIYGAEQYIEEICARKGNQEKAESESSNLKGSVSERLTTEISAQIPNHRASVQQDVGSNSINQKESSKKEFNRLLATGIRLLAMREHSVLEMTNKLSVKAQLPDLVYVVIEELINCKYLCDNRFAESYVRSRQNKGFGPIRIRKELKDKGIENNTIEDNLNVKSTSWLDIALAQHQKKYGDTPVVDYKDWAKRARFLQSRGFAMDHIQLAIPSSSFD